MDEHVDANIEARLLKKATSLDHIMSFFGSVEGGQMRQSSCIICARSMTFTPGEPGSGAGGVLEVKCPRRRRDPR